MTNITGIDIRKALIARTGRSSPREDEILEVATQLELDPQDPDFPAEVESILEQIQMGRNPHL